MLLAAAIAVGIALYILDAVYGPLTCRDPRRDRRVRRHDHDGRRADGAGVSSGDGHDEDVERFDRYCPARDQCCYWVVSCRSSNSVLRARLAVSCIPKGVPKSPRQHVSDERAQRNIHDHIKVDLDEVVSA